MVTRFARIGGVVIAAVVLTTQWPVAMRAGEAVSAPSTVGIDSTYGAANLAAAGEVTVHEWGTFTTVAGEDGRAVEWLPLGGPVDLPCFVYSFNRLLKIGVPRGPVPDYTTARTTLKGTVRMETPVLYFYAPRPAVVDVWVPFRRGLFSEWYPDANVILPPNFTVLSRSGLTDAESTGSIVWRDVNILPRAPEAPNASNVPADSGTFPSEPRESHYYAARETDASPVEVKGEREKFLFYRGVAGFASPIDATLAGDGTVTLTNRSEAGIPHLMLFTRHGSHVGYRVHAGLHANEQVILDRPAADRSLDAVTQELEQTLVGQGLYVKEAKAMIATWRDSWFEDGTRVFYVVPPATVDAVLPLDVRPKPKSVVRVFVGRAELIGDADIGIVATALAKHDHGVLERYGRLLGPIAERVLAKTTSQAARVDMIEQLGVMLKAHAARVSACGGQPPAPPETNALARAVMRALAPPW